MRLPLLWLAIVAVTSACGATASSPASSPSSTPVRTASGRVVPHPKADLARFVAAYRLDVAEYKARVPQVCADAAPPGECADELLSASIALDTSLGPTGQTLWPTDAASADADSLFTVVNTYAEDLGTAGQLPGTNAQLRAKIASAEAIDEPLVTAAIVKLTSDIAGASG